jgi:fatty-acyl-CoA synthase
MKRLMCEMRCAELTIGYGQTESAPVVTMSQPDDPMEHRVSTIGKALPCTEMKLSRCLMERLCPPESRAKFRARGTW